MSTKLNFSSDCSDALKAVRSDTDSTNWYVSSTTAITPKLRVIFFVFALSFFSDFSLGSLDRAALTYEDGSFENITLLGKGEGSVDDELLPLLAQDKIVFALVRIEELIDQSTTVKFVCNFNFAFYCCLMSNPKRFLSIGLDRKRSECLSLVKAFTLVPCSSSCRRFTSI